MPFIVAILIILCAGLFVGKHIEGAREAHGIFSSYRTRTMKGLGAWMRNAIVASLGVVVLILVLYLLVFTLHVR